MEKEGGNSKMETTVLNNNADIEITDKLLLVDDRIENLYSLEGMLQMDDRQFFLATSGNEALKIALKEKPSLIMLDVQMPEMDGFEVAKFLRSNAQTKNIPILFVTAINKDHKYVTQALEDGAVDYLFKPLDVRVTRAKVATLLRLSRQQEELERKNLQLAKLNLEKNHLLGMAAHDLRGPLGHISAFTDFILEEAELKKEHVEFLNIIKKTSKHLLNMVNNLLDVSKIESGKFELNYQSFDLVQHIVGITDINRTNAQAKSLTLNVEARPSVIFISADADKLEQVMNNLLSNAIKFSKSGTNIMVLIERHDRDVEVSVIDQGQGIPLDEQKKLFLPFQKTSVRGTAGEQSTGLGLAIIKKIIDAHKGTIRVDSKPGMGSTFSFVLPVNE